VIKKVYNYSVREKHLLANHSGHADQDGYSF